jgi:FKBP-type peptidyl-prolyl cis-trans isomerase
MKGSIVAVVGVGLLAVSALADEKAAPKAATPLKDLKAKVSYSIGLDIGKQMKAGSVDIDPDVLAQGLRDALAGKSLLSDQQLQEVQAEFRKQLVAKQAQQADARKKEGEAFLAQNAKKPGVKTLKSGLQYEVLKEGAGATPKATDTVTAHYEGRLINGEVFDSSYKRGAPADFPVNGVIPGWTEALQLMKVGSKWRIFVPTQLGYGANPRPGGIIKPNDALIFDIELLNTKPPQ